MSRLATAIEDENSDQRLIYVQQTRLYLGFSLFSKGESMVFKGPSKLLRAIRYLLVGGGVFSVFVFWVSSGATGFFHILLGTDWWNTHDPTVDVLVAFLVTAVIVIPYAPLVLLTYVRGMGRGQRMILIAGSLIYTLPSLLAFAEIYRVRSDATVWQAAAFILPLQWIVVIAILVLYAIAAIWARRE